MSQEKKNNKSAFKNHRRTTLAMYGKKSYINSLELMFESFVGSDLSETLNPAERQDVYLQKKQLQCLIKHL